MNLHIYKKIWFKSGLTHIKLRVMVISHIINPAIISVYFFEYDELSKQQQLTITKQLLSYTTLDTKQIKKMQKNN